MRAQYTLCECNDKFVLIEDGNSDTNPTMTITNDAEAVVADLFEKGLVSPSTKIFYIDTDGRVDQLLHAYRRFDGFLFGYDSLQDFYDKNII